MIGVTKAKGCAQKYCDRRTIPEIKDDVMERLIAIGKRMGKLRYLMLALLCMSLFLYHLVFHVYKVLHSRRRLSRALACFMVLVLTLTSTDLTAFANDNVSEMQGEEIVESEDLQFPTPQDEPVLVDEVVGDEEQPMEMVEPQLEGLEPQPEELEAQPEELEAQPEEPESQVVETELQSEESELQAEELELQSEESEPQTEEPELQPEESELFAEASELWAEEPEKQEPFLQNVVVDAISIFVSAPAGVFPVGAILHVDKITSDIVVEEIEQMVSDHKNGQVEESYTFDIQIWDADGQEIEPDTSKGQVEVVFQNIGVVDTKEQETSVYYVTDELDKIEEVKTRLNIDNNSVSINAEHFSIYTVVITTAVQKTTVLKYYQASTIQDSYFTIYTAEELVAYKDIMDKYFYYGTLNRNAKVETILVNADDANPMEGITGVGQEASLKLSQLNFSAKIMDDIVLENAKWSPICSIPSQYYITGNGKTITFKDKSGAASESNLVTNLLGSLDNIILVNGKDYSQRLEVGLFSESGLYASVTVRVDGKKADVGRAITGAEALAISCDGENYITLERYDDMSIYCTPIENLELGETYHVYYAYENQNGVIPAVTMINNTPAEELTAGINVDLEYISVVYELEGANTYRKNADQSLSEDVMAAVRVVVQPDGSYKAQENYEAVIKAAEGFAIPSLWKHVTVIVAGRELNYSNGDYHYVNSSTSDEGTIQINKEKNNRCYRNESRSSSRFTQNLYFGETADIQIDQNDSASISMPAAKKYFDMTDGVKTFRLYVNDPDFGVDQMYSYWCGNYAGGSYKNHAYHTEVPSTVGDSAAAFSWYVTNIPAQGYTKKSTKLGIGDATSMQNISATLSSGSFGSFSGGRQQVTLTSNTQKIIVSADGKTITAVRSSGGNSVSAKPTRTSYVFGG